MRSNFIKKFIASSLIFSMTLAIGSVIQYSPKIVQAHEEEVFRGNISISGTTTYKGRPAVTIPIPSGIRVKDVDIDNEPHDHIDEKIVNGNIVIYGLRPGVNYSRLRLTLEDYSHIEHIYNINPFTIGATNQGSNNNINVPPSIPSQGNKQAVQLYLTNVYKNVFGRQIDQQGLNYWTEKLSSGMIELEDFFKNLLSENEFLTVAPSAEDKIKKLYVGIFQREPDQRGFNYWVGKYKIELMEERSERKALREIIDDMTDSGEFKGVLARLGLRG